MAVWRRGERTFMQIPQASGSAKNSVRTTTYCSFTRASSRPSVDGRVTPGRAMRLYAPSRGQRINGENRTAKFRRFEFCASGATVRAFNRARAPRPRAFVCVAREVLWGGH